VEPTVSITFSADDPRTIRALELAAEAGQWLKCRDRDGQVLYGVPSQAIRGRYYLVTDATCDCPDFRHNGLTAARVGRSGVHRECKHILAVRLHDELVEAVRQAEPRRSDRPRSHLRILPLLDSESAAQSW
jgi:predicted nucleic acid-binding Zn finger protein